MSFRPLDAHPERAFVTAGVRWPEAEPATPGVPGGPVNLTRESGSGTHTRERRCTDRDR